MFTKKDKKIFDKIVNQLNKNVARNTTKMKAEKTKNGKGESANEEKARLSRENMG